MIRRIVTTAALGACFLAPLASHASLFKHAPVDGAATGAEKAKMVKLILKNKSASAMTVYLNDKAITLAANGGEQEVKTADGTDVYGEDRTTVRLHVTSDLGGNTVSFR